jgi:hypothetical protein
MVDRKQREERVETVRDNLPTKSRDTLKDNQSERHEKLKGRDRKKHLPPKP